MIKCEDYFLWLREQKEKAGRGICTQDDCRGPIHKEFDGFWYCEKCWDVLVSKGYIDNPPF
jgi:hypothetical protein